MCFYEFSQLPYLLLYASVVQLNYHVLSPTHHLCNAKHRVYFLLTVYSITCRDLIIKIQKLLHKSEIINVLLIISNKNYRPQAWSKDEIFSGFVIGCRMACCSFRFAVFRVMYRLCASLLMTSLCSAMFTSRSREKLVIGISQPIADIAVTDVDRDGNMDMILVRYV